MNRQNFILAFDIHKEGILENNFDEKYTTNFYVNLAIFANYITHTQWVIDYYGYDIIR